MTAMLVMVAIFACALSLLILRTALRDKRRGRSWHVYSWGFGASLLWAVAAYIIAARI